jgi:hypothetical protein
VFSLKLYRETDRTVLAHAAPMENSCVTFEEYTSCDIDPASTRNSKLKVLVSDLNEGDSRNYGCTASSYGQFGETNVATWSITVLRNREYLYDYVKALFMLRTKTMFRYVGNVLYFCKCAYVLAKVSWF